MPVSTYWVRHLLGASLIGCVIMCTEDPVQTHINMLQVHLCTDRKTEDGNDHIFIRCLFDNVS